MKKVIFVIHGLGGGGAEKVLINLISEMSPKNYDITVMTIVDAGIHRRSLPSNVHYRSLFKNPFQRNKNNAKSGSLLAGKSMLRTTIASVYQLIWKYLPIGKMFSSSMHGEYDIEVAFLEGIATKFIAASPNKSARKIAWVHVDIVNESKSSKVFRSKKEELKTYQAYDHVVAVSQGVKDAFLSLFPSLREFVSVIHNPLIKEEIVNKAGQQPKNISIDKECFTFCSIGRLSSQKAYLRLVMVANRLVEKGYRFQIWILGEGPEQSRLEELIEKLELQDTVKLLGFQENPYWFLSHSDCYVCSSIAEGYSTTIAEAIALDKPIITTDCAGMSELLRNSTSLIVENSSEGLFGGMLYALKHHDVFSHNVQYEELDCFNVNQTVNSILSILEG